MGTIALGTEIEVARIPELPQLTPDLPLSTLDKVAVYIAAENKTKQVTLGALNTFINTGGGGAAVGIVEDGGTIIYIVPSEANDTDTASIPSLAGLFFSLDKNGIPLIPLKADNSNVSVAEYEILAAGGFKLLLGDKLHTNERFRIRLYSAITGGGVGSGTGTASSLITGVKAITANTVLDPVTDVNKLIQIRSNNTAVSVTLPDIANVAANAIVAVETLLNNNKATTILTTGGQNIYLNKATKTVAYMHPGEVAWFYRGDDGWYVINDFGDKYRNLAMPKPAYKIEPYQIYCFGQLLIRSEYPRLWEYVQTLGSSFVDDTLWSTASVVDGEGNTIPFPYRGCWSNGDGTNSFRTPDLRDMFLRGLKSDIGTDPDRVLNKPGGYQPDSVGDFIADLEVPKGNSYTGSPNQQRFGNGSANPQDVVVDDINIDTPFSETKVKNIGVYWVVDF